MSAARSPLREAAGWAPGLAWRIFQAPPPTPDGKCTCYRAQRGEACDSPGKHPRFKNWQNDATFDRSAILRLADRFPTDNACVATGKASGVFVLDQDTYKGGDVTLRELERQHGELPSTPEVVTGGGGRHLYFAHPGWRVPNKVAIGPGLDVRGDGGLVVGPGSLHASGRRYEFDATRHPLDVPPAPAPAWLLEVLHRSAGDKIARDAASWAELVSRPIPEGERNASLAALAGLLFRRLPARTAAELAMVWAGARLVPPLPDEEVHRTIESIAAAEVRRRGGSQ